MFWNSSLEFLAFILTIHVPQLLNIHTTESRLNVERNAFSRVGVKIWNGIHQILKERPKKAFKRSLKATLLDVLQTEDSYIDVDTIIVKMKKWLKYLLSFIFFYFIFKIHSNIFLVFKYNSIYLL